MHRNGAQPATQASERLPGRSGGSGSEKESTRDKYARRVAPSDFLTHALVERSADTIERRT